MLQEIDDCQLKKPFKPFIIRLKDGRELLVPHPGRVHPRPSYKQLLYRNPKSGAVEAFDCSEIVAVEKAPRRRRKARARA